MTETPAAFDPLCRRLAEQLALLPDKPEETAESTARALWHAACGRPLSVMAAAETALPELDEGQMQQLEALVRQRLDGTPLAHLTGRQRFCDLEMLASPAALVPRRETELLAREAIRLARQLVAQQGKLRVVDTCTGAGNVALAIAAHVPQAEVDGTDLEADAVALAGENAAMLGLTDRVRFRCGNLLDGFGQDFAGTIDLLTCNPPYISSKRVDAMDQEIAGHEPRAAFDGGPLGVSILMRLLDDAPRLLRPGGWLAFEVGLGQGPAMVKRLQRHMAYDDALGVADEAGAIRAVVAQRKGESPHGNT